MQTIDFDSPPKVMIKKVFSWLAILKKSFEKKYIPFPFLYNQLL